MGWRSWRKSWRPSRAVRSWAILGRAICATPRFLNRRHTIRSALWICLLACILLLPASPTRAEQGYEERLVEWGLAQVGREREPSPDGKRVEEVLVASEEIIAPSDPYPRVVNIIHVKTRDSVLRREVLLEVGQPWQADKVEESERNLRKLGILAVARVIPVKGRTPGGVGLLVISKDLWSIRLNQEFNFASGVVQRYRLRPTEVNFLGLDKQLGLDLLVKIDTLAVGQTYSDPRLFGTRLSLSENASIIINRHTHLPEGTFGTVNFGLPLYTLDQENGFNVGTAWQVQRARIFRGPSVWQLPYPDADAPTGTVPYIYDDRQVVGVAGYTRSFGTRYKTNVTVGMGGFSRRFAAPPDAELSDDERAWLSTRYLPKSEDALYLSASVRTFEARYKVMRNLRSFALSEDYQLGHQVLVQARWSDPAFFSPQRFVEMGASARYRWGFGDDLLTVTGAGAARYVPGATGTGFDGPWVNKRLAFELENASPPVGVGRFVVRGLVDLHFDDANTRILLLGSGNGLRGVAAEALSGTHMMLINVEYRTRAIELLTLHAGLVAFWDVGSAFTRGPVPVHTVGLGFRFLLPQLDIEPLRVDFGYVINAANPPFGGGISSSFGQVDDYRPSFLDTPLN